MPSSNDLARLRAARALANGSTKAAAAREAGVDRATLTRWAKEPSFQDMVLKAQSGDASPEEKASKGLADLVPMAMKVLEDALTGAHQITPAQARVALDVVKAAKTFEPAASAEDTGPSTLTALIQELDARAADAG